MDPRALIRRTAVAICFCVAGGLLPACGAPLSTAVPATGFSRGASWISVDAKGDDLLYVSDQLFTDVYVLSFPALKVVGSLTGFSLPEGLCADTRGDVFVTDLLARDVVEYAHGGSSPVRTLRYRGYPQSCSVDPSTGNLAVADYGSSGSAGDIAVFQNARGKPTFYSDATIISFNNCGYDDRGNLFADGQTYGNEPKLAELPKGARELSDIEFARSFDADGSVQWDGRHVTIMGNSPRSIERLAVADFKAQVVGRTILRSPRFAFAFWIQNDKLILTYVPMHSRAKDIALSVWAYPGGGKPQGTLLQLYGAYGVTVSLAKPAR